MSRQLNAKQKKVIRNWFNDNWTGIGSLGSIDDMPLEIMERIEKINDHETIWDNVNIFIDDMVDKTMENERNSNIIEIE